MVKKVCNELRRFSKAAERRKRSGAKIQTKRTKQDIHLSKIMKNIYFPLHTHTRGLSRKIQPLLITRTVYAKSM